MISASKPGKQVVKASRIMEYAHNAESPSGSSSLSISLGGSSHARILRPSSSHELDSILITLELPVSIYFETIVQLRVRRRYTNPPHLFTFYLTHAHLVLFFTREISLIFFEKKISPEILAQKYRKIPSQNLSKEKSLQFIHFTSQR